MEESTIFDAPRSGRPSKYTDGVMRKAVDTLIASDQQLLTGSELRKKLIDAEVLDPHADRGAFMKHLRAYSERVGLNLQVNSTRTDFYLSDSDNDQRLRFAKQLQAHSLQLPWDMCIFTDEVTLEESPHPKGMDAWMLLTHLMAWLHRSCT